MDRFCIRDDIYEALVDDEAFSSLPSRLAQSFGARSVLIHWQCSNQDGDVLAHSGYFTDDQLATYAKEFAGIDPWLAIAARFQADNTVLNLESLMSVGEFQRSEFYNAYVRQMGDDTARCMGIRLSNESGSGMIAFQRGAGQAAFTEQQVARLQCELAPLRRLLTVRGRMLNAVTKGRRLEGILDTITDAAFLVRNDGFLLHANRYADSFLRAAGLLLIRSGRLFSPDAKTDEALQLGFQSACRPDQLNAGALLLADHQGRKLATITPCPVGGGRFAALLLVKSPTGASAEFKQRLQSLFRLSGSEAEVAALLAQGLSPAQIAATRAVSLGTVRTQIKSVLSKTGSTRQAEVAALLATL